MGIFEELLREKGYQPGKDVAMHHANQISEIKKKESLKNSFDLRDLEKATSMHYFKEIARNILERESDQIKEVIRIAHEKFKGKEGDKKFFWFFYQLKDELKKRPKEQHADLFRKAFRRAGWTFKASK
jgi:hypothetical protein